MKEWESWLTSKGVVKTPIVVSETDLMVAVNYLKNLPYSITKNMPEPWSRQRLLNSITESLAQQRSVTVEDVFQIAYNVWGIIKPVGTDFAGDSFTHDHRYQIWILIRPASTDPKKFIKIETK